MEETDRLHRQVMELAALSRTRIAESRSLTLSVRRHLEVMGVWLKATPSTTVQ